ncbi:MAG: excinuclease ABC subunit UvrC [Dehalococcoidia bacterium]|nr:excinuclease ABC subunit UvrC [Dehalococcoidia bacterium]
MNKEFTRLEQQLQALPARPGVYLFKDADGGILYVGKASSLRHRVASYFGAARDLSPKTVRMMERVVDVDYYVTDSEQEAILLECVLIKKHRPYYNIRLKDDKSYPYLRLTLNEDWPRAHLTRRVTQDGARYFGPYANAGHVHTAIALLEKIFRLRSCRKNITGNERRPCLEYHIRRCSGPCIGAISRSEYREAVDRAVLFLEGRQDQVLKELRAEMNQAAQRLDYEKAALIRDQIGAVEAMIQTQKVAAATGDMDAIAFVQEGDQAFALVFLIRRGRLVGREPFTLTGTREEDPSEIMTSFVQQFYGGDHPVPARILLQHPLRERAAMQRWLQERRGGRVELRVPRRGAGKALVDMVVANAREVLEQSRIRSVADPETLTAALDELQELLSLPAPPGRIECYDISNIQGTSAVGSMVVFEGGVPRKSGYRRFQIKTVTGADDYAMIQEVLGRRFRKASGRTSGDSSWAAVPDLVLIDGGKGQLNAALQALKDAGVGAIRCASIAKEEEAIFLPHLAGPLRLPRESPALRLLQRARDEAHRFAVGYYRKVHRRRTLVSSLDGVPGLGAKRKRALLRKFGSVARIRQATLEELKTVEGMNETVARRVKSSLSGFSPAG